MRSRPRRIDAHGSAVAMCAIAIAATNDARAAPARLEVAADSARVDAEEIVLDGDVDVRVAGRRLRAEHLRVKRDDQGISIDGPGDLAPCASDRPPIAFGFRSARVDVSGDVTIDGPRLKLGGVTVAWLPWLLLRPESEIGLVAPAVAWNGALGASLTEGVHVPIGRSGRDALTIAATEYLDRAGALAVAIDDAAARGAVRLDVGADSARVSGVGLDARVSGAVDLARPDGPPAIFAARLDALRGARATAEVGAIEPRLRPFDAGDVALSSRSIELSAAASAARGGPLDGIDARRIVAAWSDGAGLGRVGAIGGGVSTALLGSVGGPQTWTSAARAEASLAETIGPIRWALRAASLAAASSRTVGVADSDRDLVAAGGATFEASMPLADASAGRDAAWIHILEPVARARAIAASATAFPLAASTAWLGSAPATQAFVALAGLRTSYARSTRGLERPSRVDLSASIWFGRAVGLVEGPENVGAMQIAIGDVGASGSRLAFDARAATSVRDDGARAWVAIASASVRDPGGLGASIRGTARGVGDVRAFDVVMGERELAIDAPTAWLAHVSSGAASSLGVGGDWPLGRAWSMGIDLDGARVDLATTIVRAAGRLAFADPCGCLAVRVVGGHLLGRQGVDLLASIELAPMASLPPRASSR